MTRWRLREVAIPQRRASDVSWTLHWVTNPMRRLSTQGYLTAPKKAVIPASRLLWMPRTPHWATSPAYEWGASLYAKLLNPAKQSRHPSGALVWVTNSTLWHEPFVWMRRTSLRKVTRPHKTKSSHQRRVSMSHELYIQSRTLSMNEAPLYAKLLDSTKQSRHPTAARLWWVTNSTLSHEPYV